MPGPSNEQHDGPVLVQNTKCNFGILMNEISYPSYYTCRVSVVQVRLASSTEPRTHLMSLYLLNGENGMAFVWCESAKCVYCRSLRPKPWKIHVSGKFIPDCVDHCPGKQRSLLLL